LKVKPAVSIAKLADDDDDAAESAASDDAPRQKARRTPEAS
jgi:hypothetical protein